MIRPANALAVTCAVVGFACGSHRTDPTAAPIADFNKRVDAYVHLRDSLANRMGPLEKTASQSDIAARAVTLAELITTARSSARPGDLFTADVATVFATMIKEEYRRRPDSLKDSRKDTQRELASEEVADFEPKVNLVYPTSYPLPTFPATLLPLLPRLPANKLEYRIVKHSLILRDVEANLIVDYMPNAVP
jgi:hypothetical protein